MKYVDPDGREDDFNNDEKKFILETKNQVVTNLETIISELNESVTSEYKKLATDYLGLDLDNEQDKEFLINSLTKIKDDLAGMNLSDFAPSKKGMMSYVHSRTKTYPDGRVITSYDKTIYLDSFSTSEELQSGLSSPLDQTLIHETSHKVLNTRDIGYSFELNLIKDLPKYQKLNNADNWACFYGKMRK